MLRTGTTDTEGMKINFMKLARIYRIENYIELEMYRFTNKLSLIYRLFMGAMHDMPEK